MSTRDCYVVRRALDGEQPTDQRTTADSHPHRHRLLHRWTECGRHGAAVVMAAALFATGCGTINTQVVAHQDAPVSCRELCGSTPNVYGGVAYSVRMMLQPLYVDACAGGESRLAFGLLWPLLLPFYIVDVPLSFAADTIILPYTAYRQASRGDVCASGT